MTSEVFQPPRDAAGKVLQVRGAQRSGSNRSLPGHE